MPANIEQNIKKIRELFEEELIDAYIIPHEDEFLTEYVPDHSERLAFITGFSGSAGLAIITKNKAAIFVDGRYTTQVKIQTSGKIFDHENLNYSDIEKWIKLNLKEWAKNSEKRIDTFGGKKIQANKKIEGPKIVRNIPTIT